MCQYDLILIMVFCSQKMFRHSKEERKFLEIKDEAREDFQMTLVTRRRVLRAG